MDRTFAPSPLTTRDLEREETIAEAMQDALNDGDGRPRPNALAHHLAKHGLVIVESARHDRILTTLQFVGSVLEPIVEGRSASLLPIGIGRALRGVVTRVKELG
jgi:hypothetical protein